ncbi:AMP-binding protein [Fodinicola feengrottensis]|uniref:AMP-binding protein n=1 Tax=Fodinicola feengrottensis TaxID=435914 RepID=A0ABN2JAJ8_9ACTN|nr:AMP-binding protein [Fodinicola feengrottensis]
MNLDTAIETYARERGDDPALVLYAQRGTQTVRDTVTWAELQRETSLLAGKFSEGKHCVVVVMTRHDRTDLANLLAALRTEQSVLVVSGGSATAAHQALVDELRSTVGSVVVAQGKVVETDPTVPLGPPLWGPSVTMLASGGTTSRPKIVLDHSIRLAGTRPREVRLYPRTGWREGQRQVICSPLYHAAGLTPFIEGIVDGNVNYVLEQFDPALLIDMLATGEIEWIQATPFHLGALLARPNGLDSVRPGPVVVHGAEHCPSRVKAAVHAHFGASRVYEIYAASEGIGVTIARGDEWEMRPGTVGRGFFTSVRIADENGFPMPAGIVGTVYLRTGGRRAATYLQTTGRLRATPDGYVTLGDIGHVDEDGYLYLAPRQIGTMTVGGVTVVATEVESALLEHPDVIDVGVFGQYSAVFGERVVAAVVARTEHLSDRALRQWARPRLSAAQLPVGCFFVPSLPRQPGGGIDRIALAALGDSS